MDQSISPNTTTDSSGMVTTNTSAALTSMVKAITIAPNTTNGERSSRRSARFTPDCTWLMSLVMRVMRVLTPSLSCCAKLSDWMCAKHAERILVAKPTDARAAKYCAVMEHTRPITASATSTPHMHSM